MLIIWIIISGSQLELMMIIWILISDSSYEPLLISDLAAIQTDADKGINYDCFLIVSCINAR
jgi:hypothetical protein